MSYKSKKVYNRPMSQESLLVLRRRALEFKKVQKEFLDSERRKEQELESMLFVLGNKWI